MRRPDPDEAQQGALLTLAYAAQAKTQEIAEIWDRAHAEGAMRVDRKTSRYEGYWSERGTIFSRRPARSAGAFISRLA
jgi:hypothetical protein